MQQVLIACDLPAERVERSVEMVRRHELCMILLWLRVQCLCGRMLRWPRGPVLAPFAAIAWACARRGWSRDSFARSESSYRRDAEGRTTLCTPISRFGAQGVRRPPLVAILLSWASHYEYDKVNVPVWV